MRRPAPLPQFGRAAARRAGTELRAGALSGERPPPLPGRGAGGKEEAEPSRALGRGPRDRGRKSARLAEAADKGAPGGPAPAAAPSLAAARRRPCVRPNHRDRLRRGGERGSSAAHVTGHVTHPAGAILGREGRPLPPARVQDGAGGRKAGARRGALCHSPRLPPDCAAGGGVNVRPGDAGSGALPLSIRGSLKDAGRAGRPLGLLAGTAAGGSSARRDLARLFHSAVGSGALRAAGRECRRAALRGPAEGLCARTLCLWSQF